MKGGREMHPCEFHVIRFVISSTRHHFTWPTRYIHSFKVGGWTKAAQGGVPTFGIFRIPIDSWLGKLLLCTMAYYYTFILCLNNGVISPSFPTGYAGKKSNPRHPSHSNIVTVVLTRLQNNYLIVIMSHYKQITIVR